MDSQKRSCILTYTFSKFSSSRFNAIKDFKKFIDFLKEAIAQQILLFPLKFDLNRVTYFSYIAVPIFIPTTRNTTRGIKKFMRKMKSKMPENVFEAQLLEMAGAAKGEDEVYSDDSEYDANFIDDEEDGEGGFQHPQKPGKLHTNVFCFFFV